jgi:hypothetical protein
VIKNARDENVEAVRLRAWADDIVIGRFHVPHYANPGELKADVRAVLALLSAAVEGQAAAEQRAADAEKALREHELVLDGVMTVREAQRRRHERRVALAAARAGEATEERT